MYKSLPEVYSAMGAASFKAGKPKRGEGWIEGGMDGGMEGEGKGLIEGMWCWASSPCLGHR